MLRSINRIFDNNHWLFQLFHLVGQVYLFVTIPDDVHIDVVAAVVLIVSRNVIAKGEEAELGMRCFVQGSGPNARPILFGG